MNLPGAPSLRRTSVPLAFLAVYLCWGATYTAMSVGVHLLPAPILAGTRLSIGAAIMLTFCAVSGRPLVCGSAIMLRLAVIGTLLLFGGNVGLVWSEKYIASGLAALLVAVVPLYVALVEALLPGGEQLQSRGLIGLALGFVGLLALLWPSFHAVAHRQGGSTPMQFLAALVVLLGALSWACGSVLARRLRLPVDPLVAAGWEMLAAGLCNVVLATATREWPRAVWNIHSIAATAYLVLFGSLLGFSCYIWLIHHVPVAKVATYAYVNPVVAVILGALILGEHLQRTEYIGMIAVLSAVALVTSSQMKSGRAATTNEAAPVESDKRIA